MLIFQIELNSKEKAEERQNFFKNYYLIIIFFILIYTVSYFLTKILVYSNMP